MHRGDAYPPTEQAHGDGQGEAQFEAGHSEEGQEDERRSPPSQGPGEHQHRGASEQFLGTEEDLTHGLLLYSTQNGRTEDRR